MKLGLPTVMLQAVLWACVGQPASSARAAMATYTYTGTGSGSIGTTSFTNKAFTFACIADTANRFQRGNGWQIAHTSASVTIADLGTYSFSIQTSTAVNNGATGGNVVFANYSADLALYTLGYDNSLKTWDLTTSIGPLSMPSGHLVQWGGLYPPVPTSGGILFFNDAIAPGTFQAVVVPAPTTFLPGGLAAWLCTARRRR